MSKKLWQRALPALVMWGCMASASAQVAVIVNPKSGIDTMSGEQVAAIFLGKTATLPGGAAAKMADQPEGGPVYEAFYSKVAGKTGAQVKAAWSRLTFSGKATPPTAMANSAEVKKFVASQPDAIGYIEKSAVDASVKVVLTAD